MQIAERIVALFNYTLTNAAGDVIDSSEGREPLEFEVGSGMVIKGFDDGVLGMEVGNKRTLEIPLADASPPTGGP